MKKSINMKKATTTSINNANNPVSACKKQRGFMFPSLFEHLFTPAEENRLDSLSDDELLQLIAENDINAAQYYVYYRHAKVFEKEAMKYKNKIDPKTFISELMSEVRLSFDNNWGKIAKAEAPSYYTYKVIENTAKKIFKQETNYRKMTYTSLVTGETITSDDPMIVNESMIVGQKDSKAYNNTYYNTKSYSYADTYLADQGLEYCLEKLTSNQRRVIELWNEYGLSSKETADLMSKELGKPISAANVDNHYSRGMRKMRELISCDAA